MHNKESKVEGNSSERDWPVGYWPASEKDDFREDDYGTFFIQVVILILFHKSALV